MSIRVGLLTWGLGEQEAIDVPGVSIYKPTTQVLHPLPETNTDELIPGIIAEDQDIRLVPISQILEPLPETDTEDLRPSITTEEGD